MRKLVAYISAWALYWLGHWTSLVMGAIPSLYSTYRWLMYKSMNVQDWAGNETPWKHVNDK
jgi:hypothetical protein